MFVTGSVYWGRGKRLKRWINFPILPRFQPIEFLKPFLIISLSLVIDLGLLLTVILNFS